MLISGHSDPLGDVEALSSLADERRRRLYDYVIAARRPVGRDEAAAAAGIGRSLAAYHLDRLAEARLLDVVFSRPPGRSGPGAGRPAKLYIRADQALEARTHARDYAFVAELLAEIVDAASPAVVDGARSLARERGQTLGAELTSVDELELWLTARGYEPHRDPDGTIRLGNCPFGAVAAAHPELVCGLNRMFLGGVLDASGAVARIGELDPASVGCCVTLRTRAA